MKHHTWVYIVAALDQFLLLIYEGEQHRWHDIVFGVMTLVFVIYALVKYQRDKELQ